MAGRKKKKTAAKNQVETLVHADEKTARGVTARGVGPR